jgi:hypothetical protein
MRAKESRNRKMRLPEQFLDSEHTNFIFVFRLNMQTKKLQKPFALGAENTDLIL